MLLWLVLVCRRVVEAVVTCSRGCGAHKEPLREADMARGSGKGKRLQLWEIQKTLGRGDFIEVSGVFII